MSDRIWLKITTVCAQVGFVISTLANFVILTLLVVRPAKALGSYKYLMIIFCIFSLFYTSVETFLRPLIHMYDNTLFVIQQKRFQYSDLTARFISATYCGCYAMSFTLFAVHFVYRYFTACKPENLRLFRGFKFFGWMLGSFLTAMSWGMVTFFLFPETDRTKQALLFVLKESYNLDPLWIGHVPYSYSRIDGNGIKHPDISNIVGILQHGAIMIFSFSTVFYCGMQTHRKIKSHKGVSGKTRKLQNKLFYALVLQTIIPIFLMYIPTVMAFVLPFFEINIGCYANITTVTVQLYPGIDPLVLLFLIKDIRNAFFQTVCFREDNKHMAHTPTMQSYKLNHVLV